MEFGYSNTEELKSSYEKRGSEFREEVDDIFESENCLSKDNFKKKLLSLGVSSFPKFPKLVTSLVVSANDRVYRENVESILNFYSTSFGSGLSYMDEILQQKWFFVGPADEYRFLNFSENQREGAFLIFNSLKESYGFYVSSKIYAKISENEKKIFSIQKEGNTYFLEDEKGNVSFSKDQTDFMTFIKTISTRGSDISGERFLKAIFLEKVSQTEDTDFDKIITSLNNSNYGLNIGEPYGSGAFGKVFKGEFKGKTVVVKILKQTFLHTILREYSSHRVLFHPYLIRCLQFIQEHNALILEYAPKTLPDFMKAQIESIRWPLRFKFLSQISSVMSYLHDNGLNHRDLRSPNILLDENLDIKITDLGIAYWSMEGEKLDEILKRPDMSFYIKSKIFKMLLDSVEQHKRIDFIHFGIIMCDLLFHGDQFDKWEKEVNPLPEWTPFAYRELIYYCFSPSFYISFPLIEYFVKKLEKELFLEEKEGPIPTQIPEKLSNGYLVESYLKQIIPLLFEKSAIPIKKGAISSITKLMTYDSRMFSLFVYLSKDENSQIRKKILQAMSHFISHPIPGVERSKIEPIAIQALSDSEEEVKNIANRILEKISDIDANLISKQESKKEEPKKESREESKKEESREEKARKLIDKLFSIVFNIKQGNEEETVEYGNKEETDEYDNNEERKKFINEQEEKKEVQTSFLWLDLYLLKIHGVEIEHNIGQGNFGTVSRGFYKGEVVAIKHNTDKRISGFQELIRASGISHSNIISIRAFIPETQTIVMEYAEGYEGSTTLQQFLEKQQSPISEKLRLKFMKEISSAMSYLHSKKILHRDLRTANILLTKNKDLKLADFGIAFHIGKKGFKETNLPTYSKELYTVSSVAAFTEFIDIKFFSVILFKFLLFGVKVKNYTDDSHKFVYPPETSKSYSSLIKACCNENLNLNFFAISYFVEKMESFIVNQGREDPSFLENPSQIANYLCQGVRECSLNAIRALSYQQEFSDEAILNVVESLLLNLERNPPKEIQLACLSTLFNINSQIVLSKKAKNLVIQRVPQLLDSGTIVDPTISYETGKFLSKISKKLTQMF